MQTVENYPRVKRIIEVLMFFSIFISILLVWIRWSWNFLHFLIPKLSIRRQWTSILIGLIHCLLIFVLIYGFVLELGLHSERKQQLKNESMQNPLDGIEEKIGITINKFYEIPKLPSEIENKYEIQNFVFQKIGFQTIDNITNYEIKNAMKNCPKSLESFKKIQKYTIEILLSKQFYNVITEFEYEFQARDLRRIQIHLEDIEEYFEELGPFVRKTRIFVNETIHSRIEFITDNSARGVHIIFIPTGLLIPLFTFSMLINFVWRKSSPPKIICQFQKSVFYLISILLIYLAIRGIIQSNNSDSLCVSDKSMSFSIPVLNINFNDGLRSCAEHNQYFFNNVKMAKFTFLERSSKVLNSYLQGFFERKYEQLSFLKDFEQNSDCLNNSKISEYFRTIRQYLNFKLDRNFARYAILNFYNGSLKVLEDSVKQINVAIDIANFECEPLYDIISKCFGNISIIENLVEMSIVLCCLIYLVLYILMLRKTDLSQYSEDRRQTWIEKMNKNIDAMINIYNEELINYIDPKATSEYFEANMENNRYDNVPCQDEYRIILPGSKQYIHANYLKIPKTLLDPNEHRALYGYLRKYIITQAPILSTVSDFWQMCWQENVKVIVMFCEQSEMIYYPKQIGESFEFPDRDIQVICRDIQRHPIKGVEYRIFELRTPEDTKLIQHLSINWWKQNEAPENIHIFLDLFRWVNKKTRKFNMDSPILVHSMKGIGRAGTYVAFDYIYSRIFEDSCFDTSKLIMELRKYRYGLVESSEQFVFLNVALVEFMAMKGVCDTNLGIDLVEEYEEWLENSSSSKKTEISKV
ncbi:unnamed protein product [Caenorhabditis angaria]|uniref:Tyrosine-protein phosphatase domain-containing protein n=1 Tax=Caenorhabditis angaria TaxID=860376 RepID=A0A9P1MYB9_9PELO|nr:unnamed protein product [Caenorhabditis angaria]